MTARAARVARVVDNESKSLATKTNARQARARRVRPRVCAAGAGERGHASAPMPACTRTRARIRPRTPLHPLYLSEEKEKFMARVTARQARVNQEPGGDDGDG